MAFCFHKVGNYSYDVHFIYLFRVYEAPVLGPSRDFAFYNVNKYLTSAINILLQSLLMTFLSRFLLKILMTMAIPVFCHDMNGSGCLKNLI